MTRRVRALGTIASLIIIAGICAAAAHRTSEQTNDQPEYQITGCSVEQHLRV